MPDSGLETTDATLLADGEADVDEVGDDEDDDPHEAADDTEVFKTWLLLASTKPDSLLFVVAVRFAAVDCDFESLLFDVFCFKLITDSGMFWLLLKRNFFRSECGLSVHSR